MRFFVVPLSDGTLIGHNGGSNVAAVTVRTQTVKTDNQLYRT
jgi:hypothetical protein